MKKLFFIKKKGFRLIELLAVIVILAVILLIAMPIVVNVINESKTKSFEATARGLEKVVENEYMRNIVKDDDGAARYEFSNREFVVGEGLSTFPHTGQLPEEGFIEVDEEGNIWMAIKDGENIVTKISTEKDITSGKEGKDFEGKTFEEIKTEVNDASEGGGSVGAALPDTEEITYINNPEDSNYPENATPCLIEGNEFTHIIDKREPDPLNHKTYAVTKIGEQCWFAENLAYTGNGCLSNSWTSSAPFDACQTPGPNEGSNQDSYQDGLPAEMVLYQWEAAMDGITTEGAQGLCPDGWYIPSHDEWTDLERYVCNEAGNGDCDTKFPKDTTTIGWRGTDEGERLKDNTNWNGTTNSLGFSALPAGLSNTSGTLYNVGSLGNWWSSSPSGSSAWRRYLGPGSSDVNRNTYSQAFGFSVRCLLGQ